MKYLLLPLLLAIQCAPAFAVEGSLAIAEEQKLIIGTEHSQCRGSANDRALRDVTDGVEYGAAKAKEEAASAECDRVANQRLQNLPAAHFDSEILLPEEEKNAFYTFHIDREKFLDQLDSASPAPDFE